MEPMGIVGEVISRIPTYWLPFDQYIKVLYIILILLLWLMEARLLGRLKRIEANQELMIEAHKIYIGALKEYLPDQEAIGTTGEASE